MLDKCPIIDRIPTYKGRKLSFNSEDEFWFQRAILDGNNPHGILLEMITNKSILNCTIDTFELMAMFIEFTNSKVNGRPKKSDVDKLNLNLKIVRIFKEEITKRNSTRLEAIHKTAKVCGVSESHVEKALKYFYVGARSANINKVKDKNP
jgi:hypothetical protein